MTYAPNQTSSDGTPADSERPSRRGFGCAFEIIETLVLTLVIYLLIHNFVAQPFEVQQESMLPTITPSDYVLIEKVTPRFGDYQLGDVIVFHPPSGYEQGGIPFIKRIIGLPGDTVRLENGRVLVTPPNGETVHIEEPYVARTGDGRPVPTQNHGPNPESTWTIPDGSYFVMGDNREKSEDSRVFGPIGRDAIIGRAWLRYFPLDRVGFIERPTYPGLSGQPQESPAAASPARGLAPAAQPALVLGHDPGVHIPRVVEQLTALEPQAELLGRRFGRIRRMDQVAQRADAEIAADRAGVRLVGHGLADQAANGRDRIGPFEGEGGDRA